MSSTSSSNTVASNPLNPGFFSVLFAFVLIGLKVLGILSIPWWLALLPVYFWYALAVGLPILMLGSILGLLLIAVPVIGIALLVAPAIERLMNGKQATLVEPDDVLRWKPDPRVDATIPLNHETLPEDAGEPGMLSDHEGVVYGYVKITEPGTWWGPKYVYGLKGSAAANGRFGNTRFAPAPVPPTVADESTP